MNNETEGLHYIQLVTDGNITLDGYYTRQEFEKIVASFLMIYRERKQKVDDMIIAKENKYVEEQKSRR